MTIWGLSFVWTKIVYDYYSPITTITLRVFFATALLLLANIIFRWVEKPKKKDIPWLILLGFTEPFLYFMGESHGLNIVSSTFASLMIATIPVFTLIAGRIFINERLRPINSLGIVMSFTGIIIMIMKPDFSILEPLEGILLMLLAVFSAVVYTVLIKRMSNNYKAVSILFYQNIFGLMFFIPFFLYYGLDNFLHTEPDLRLISTLGMLVLFATLIAYFFLIKVVDKIGISKANVFANFVPVVTAIAAWFLLPDESPTYRTVVGISIVIAGIFLSQAKAKTK